MHFYNKHGDEKDVELWIAGDGSKYRELRELVGDYARIKLLGRKTKEEVGDLMEKASCLVVPSFCYENSPTVIYEAVSKRLPVLAADIGGIPELVKEVGGELFKTGNSFDLLAKMEGITKYSEKLALNEIKEEKFIFSSPSNYAKRITSLISEDAV